MEYPEGTHCPECGRKMTELFKEYYSNETHKLEMNLAVSIKVCLNRKCSLSNDLVKLKRWKVLPKDYTAPITEKRYVREVNPQANSKYNAIGQKQTQQENF
jgi:translation elongation factor EF-4